MGRWREKLSRQAEDDICHVRQPAAFSMYGLSLCVSQGMEGKLASVPNGRSGAASCTSPGAPSRNQRMGASGVNGMPAIPNAAEASLLMRRFPPAWRRPDKSAAPFPFSRSCGRTLSLHVWPPVGYALQKGAARWPPRKDRDEPSVAVQAAARASRARVSSLPRKAMISGRWGPPMKPMRAVRRAGATSLNLRPLPSI